MNSTLIVIASEVEFSGLFPHIPISSVNNSVFSINGKTSVSVLGIGLVNFGAHLARILAEKHFETVILTGICGAYPQSGLAVGDVVRVDTEKTGDWGVQEKDGSFIPWTSINNGGKSVYSAASPDTAPGILRSFRGVSGLSVNCSTGTEATAMMRYHLFGADVESMEGAAGFAVCNAFNIPVFEIRAVSNIATTRNTASWHVAQALDALKKQFLDRWNQS
jgi:futalosine hydrolase